MKRLVALCGALVLALAMATPAAADQKVWVEEFAFEDAWVEEVSLSNGWDFECAKPIWYKGKFRNDLWLWYPNNVDEADMMPADGPWPWTRGMVKNKGVDTFASNEGFSGKVLRSTLRLTTKLYDHEIDGSAESWKEKLTGKDWNLSAPGYGWIFKLVPNVRYTVDIIDGEWYFSDFVPKGTTVEVYDNDALCDFFGAGPAVYP
jgi:hypothetical protein